MAPDASYDSTISRISSAAELELANRIKAATSAAGYLKTVGGEDPTFRAFLYDLVVDGLEALKSRLQMRAGDDCSASWLHRHRRSGEGETR